MDHNNQPPRRDAGAQSGSTQRRRKKRRRGSPLATVGKVIGTLLLIMITTGAILACFAAIYINTVIIPQANLDLYELTMDMSLSSTMYYTDRQTGERRELRTIHGEENRIWIEYENIPKNLIDAAIAIEDKRFESHNGVDWIRTGNAVLRMLTGGNIQGGSTITQQLIKNLTQEKDITVKRKILEIFRALQFEKKYSKEVIMEWYLNYIYLGQGCSGVYTASYQYFGKNVTELSLAECASLISITNNPSLYDPYRSGMNEDGTVNPDWGRTNNAKRAQNVLYQMLDQGKITQAEYDEAVAQVKAGLNFTSAAEDGGSSQATNNEPYTWYEDQVIKDVIRDLVALGYEERVANNMVFYGGLTIETCIDPRIQAIVDEIYENEENLNIISSSGQQLQSAMVIVDVNGDVVALSGGMGEKEGSRSWNRATDSLRPPGSAFKPLAVYAPAMEAGLVTPSSVLDDAPYRVEGGQAWPSNVDRTYRGRMSVFESVERSTNPAAVRTLVMLTPEESYNFLVGIGFADDLVYSEERNGRVFSDVDLAPLAMGGLTDGVSVLHMAAAYSIFPRDGVYLEPRTYSVVKDSKGRVLLDKQSDRVGVPVLSPETCWYTNYMLKSAAPNGANTNTNAQFGGMTIAGKTGSTNSNKDRWFVGYTPYYTAAVWVGFDQQERIRSNGNPAVGMWRKVMEPVHQGLENKDFSKPDGLMRMNNLCAESGMIATENCGKDPRGLQSASGWFFRGDEPSQYCTVHSDEGLVEICLDSPILNAKGAPSGMYHLAGEFCPEDRRRTVSLMVLDREDIMGVLPQDAVFTKAYIDSLGAEAQCHVHTTAPTPPPTYDPLHFNPADESTWPTQEQWPGFHIEDPLTWPHAVAPEPDPGTEPGQGEVTPPIETDIPGAGERPVEPSPPPTEGQEGELPPAPEG